MQRIVGPGGRLGDFHSGLGSLEERALLVLGSPQDEKDRQVLQGEPCRPERGARLGPGLVNVGKGADVRLGE